MIGILLIELWGSNGGSNLMKLIGDGMWGEFLGILTRNSHEGNVWASFWEREPWKKKEISPAVLQ